MKLLIDMNLSPRWQAFLSDAGYDAVHWSAVGLATAGDPVIMDYAKANGFVVLTHDLDFGAILAATGGVAPSVVQIRADDLSMEAIGSQVLKSLEQIEDQLAEGALATIDAARARVTLLPIGEVGPW